MAPLLKGPEHTLEDAVSRALRDNLAPLQRMSEELQQACADFVSACSSSRPSNALPAMLRAQAAAASLASNLSVLTNFVTAALWPRELPRPETVVLRSVDVEPRQPATAPGAPPWPPTPMADVPNAAVPAPEQPVPVAGSPEPLQQIEVHVIEDPEPEAPVPESVLQGQPLGLGHSGPSPNEISEDVMDELTAGTVGEPLAFDLLRLPQEDQELHRRANRVAKVAMQDIQLLRPDEVLRGRQQKDLCARLRGDLDKARREYERRFRAILDHPVDYFHHWMIQILANGDPQALGEYPYPTSAPRR